MKNLESFLSQGDRNTVKSAAFFLSLKQKTAAEVPVAPAALPPEEQISHTANLAAALADAATCTLGLSNKYRLYAESINGEIHTHFAEMFVEWAAEVADGASFLIRKANVYGGAVSLGEIESPLASTNIEPILQALLACEKECVDKLKIVHSLMKEDPSIYELEQYMSEAGHRMDDLIQSMSAGIVEKLSSFKGASSQEEREKGEERARVNAHAHAEAHRQSRGERIGHMAGNVFGGVGGAAAGYNIAKKLNMGDKEKLVAAIAGGIFGKSTLGDIGKDIGKSRDANRMKSASDGFDTGAEAGAGEGVTATETTPQETNEELLNQHYMATEGEARRAEAIAQAMYYKQQSDTNKQQLEQANQALQQTQQQAAQLQQQNDQTQQQIQGMMQQSQQMTDMALSQMAMANQRVMQATEQSIQATNEMQQQTQMAAEIRNAWNQMRAQLMQTAAVEPPAATLQGAQAQQQQAMAQQQAAQMGGAVDPNAQQIPQPAEQGAPPPEAAQAPQAPPPADTGVAAPEAPQAPEIQPPKTASEKEEHHGKREAKHPYLAGFAGGVGGAVTGLGGIPGGLGGYYGARRAAETGHNELGGAAAGAVGAGIGGAVGGLGGGLLGSIVGGGLSAAGIYALAKRNPQLAAELGPMIAGAGVYGGGTLGILGGTYAGGRKGYDVAMDAADIPPIEKGASVRWKTELLKGKISPGDLSNMGVGGVKTSSVKTANPHLKHMIQMAKERAPYGLAGAGLGAAAMHHDILNADVEGRKNRISEMEQSSGGTFPEALNIAREKMLLVRDELGQQHPDAMRVGGAVIGGIAGLSKGPEIAQNLRDINRNMADYLK